MKKLTAGILIIIAILSFSATPLMAAGSVSISLSTSTRTVRISDTITITGTVSASQMLATFDLNVTYNASQLQYVNAEGLSPVITSGELDIGPSSGSIQFLYLDGDGGGSGITTGNAFRITFNVIGGSVGDTISIGCSVKTAGDSSAAAMSASGSGTSMTIAAPLSTNNYLSNLSVNGGTLSPAFAKSTTTYSMAVPFSVAKINVTAAAEDATAKVSISSPDLTAAGTTAVKITVTAQSGAKKTYTINVSRAQDPNYVASSINDLTSLSVDGFLLSPVFDAAKTEYIVYLPFEVEQVTVSAAPADSKAAVAVEGNALLVAGQANPIKVNCTAENGTIKTYIINAQRALPFSTGSAAASPTPIPTPTPTPTEISPTPMPEPSTDSSSDETFNTILIIVLAVAVVAESGYILYMAKKNSSKNDAKS